MVCLKNDFLYFRYILKYFEKRLYVWDLLQNNLGVGEAGRSTDKNRLVMSYNYLN